MRSSPSPRRHWGGSLVVAHRVHSCAQRGRCRECGHPVEWYGRGNGRSVRLHPGELPAVSVPVDLRAVRTTQSTGSSHPPPDRLRCLRSLGETGWFRAIPKGLPTSAAHRATPLHPPPLRAPCGRNPMRRPDTPPRPLYPEAARPGQPSRHLEVGACHGRTGSTRSARKVHGLVRLVHPALRGTAALAHAALPCPCRRSLGRRPRDGRLGALRSPRPPGPHPLPPADPRTSSASWRPCSAGSPAMTHHAVEILLLRLATHDELRRACRTLPVGANHDGTRLMAVHPARTPGRALRSVRRRLRHILPIDVLTTHYADPWGRSCSTSSSAWSHEH
ncbi:MULTISPECIES: DUF6083 domain-containing protein [unclassified Streptomyces]|uniref:DUF6083 domain-containing protein n=1 Tax=unclassified Streptomyces TaxID=2593676 RepID=UPI000A512C2A|nr:MULTISPECIES: DUF6083 domain-containing protein [unclassified Streptomyces]